MSDRKLFNLMCVLFVTMTATAFAFVGHGIFRTVFTLLLVFALPGYATMAAWFPKRLTKFPGNILFVIVLSLSVTSLSGVLLHKTPWGMQPHTWALWLGGLTLVNLMIAFRRGEILFGSPRPRIVRLPTHQMLFMIGGVVLTVFALNLARQGVLEYARTGFTQLWMVPSDTPHSVIVGVRNEENQATGYKLVIQGRVTLFEETFQLNESESWERSIELSFDSTQKIRANLYRLDQPDRIYRNTTLWLQDTE